ncbi:hypothetical protein AAC387_Pa06g2395 [Persea americana]
MDRLTYLLNFSTTQDIEAASGFQHRLRSPFSLGSPVGPTSRTIPGCPHSHLPFRTFRAASDPVAQLGQAGSSNGQDLFGFPEQGSGYDAGFGLGADEYLQSRANAFRFGYGFGRDGRVRFGSLFFFLLMGLLFQQSLIR